MDDNTNIQDALVEDTEDTKATSSDTNGDAATLMAVESAIKIHMAKIDRTKEDLKPVKEMMKSFLDNDPGYREATEVALKASKIKSAKKRELLETQNGKELSSKIEMLTVDLRESEEALSHYLREYQRLTGLNEFEGEDGELRQIVYVAKLVRKTNLNK